MKKLFYVLGVIFVSTFTYAQSVDETKIDIYFGNGVWNKQFSNDGCKKDGAANCSKEDLNDLIKEEIIATLSASEAKRYGDVKLQYNWGLGDVEDLLETFYQLKKAGQMSYLFYQERKIGSSLYYLLKYDILYLWLEKNEWKV